MKTILSIFIVTCFVATSFAQSTVIKKDSLVQQFYSINNKPLYWFSSRKDTKRATEWLTAIEAAKESGLVSRKLMTGEIRTAMLTKNTRDKTVKANTDMQITGLVLNFIKELQEVKAHFEYDEVSIPQSDSVYIYQLINSKNKGPVSKIISELDCQDHDYQVLKKFLKDSITDKNSVKYKSVILSMNYLKYLSVNRQPEYIVANIPETEVRYYRNDQLALKMKTVVGKKKNQTPVLASYITNIVSFPFWNVPFSIASKELLPKVQKDESYLERNNFEVVDAKGNVIDDSDLNWADYDEKNFPYFFRESTGPNNSLGVLKFNLQNPFSIYLHDTNSKGAFAKDYRFLSHGCVRLEKPVELADALLRGKIDIQELKSGKKDTESKTIKLAQKVPVFIIYMPVTVEGQKVTFLKDVYGLIQ
ncbi:MAG: L,D-transpeptidase family protein [Bacteroidota bacterium]|nr:L,D-transpeptidase family protein [Bacteroidota bacterium]